MNEQNKNDTRTKKKLYKRWWFWLVVIVGVFTVAFFVSEEDTSEAQTTQTDTQAPAAHTTEEAFDVDAYRRACTHCTYDDLARNPDKYKGQNVKRGGMVMQVIEDGKNVTLLVNVTADEYGIYDDTVYVTYTLKEGEGRILEDDLVYIYGVYQGLYTYTSTSFEDNTVPYIAAKHIELQTLENFSKYNGQ